MGAVAGRGRVVLLGVGLGLGLLLLEASAPRGWAGGAAALVSLVPVAVAIGLGGWPGAACALAVAVGGGAWLDGSMAMVIALRHGLPGLALGLALRRRWPLPMALLSVSATSLVGLGLLLWAFLPAGTSPLTLLERQVESQVSDLEQLPASLGMGGEPGWAADSARAVATAMRVAGPAIVVVALLLGGVVNYALARLWLRGSGFRPFAEEAVPDHLVWGVIAGGVMLLSGQPGVDLVGVNLLIVLAALYAIQGLAVLRHFFLRVRVPALVQVMSFGLFAHPLLLVAAACVGLSDLWVDFRKIRGVPTPA